MADDEKSGAPPAPQTPSQRPVTVSAVSYPALELITGPEEGLVAPLKSGSQILGRSEEAGIRVSDTSVSRVHSQINVEGDKVRILDMGSRNGTLVNGVAVTGSEVRELNHLDLIQTGIYQFRLLFREMTEAETENPIPGNPTSSNPVPTKKGEEAATSFVATPGEAAAPAGGALPPEAVSVPVTGNESPAADLRQQLTIQEDQALSPALSKADSGLSRKLRRVFFLLAGVSALLGLISYVYYRAQEQKIVEPDPIVDPFGSEDPKNPLEPPPDPPPINILPLENPPVKMEPPTLPPVSRVLSAFLDVTAQPMPARIFFEGKDLGLTPVKSSISVEPGKTYEVTAEFELKDVRDRQQQRLTFTADPRKEVIPLVFKGEIGSVKVLKLPRGTSFHLSGYYAYDTFKTHPLNVTQVNYGQPLYIPYGRYTVELRERTQVGGSTTYVDEIRYHRDFVLDATREEVELDLTERDMQFFPARIQSAPSGAEIFVDGVKAGVTPFEGDLPLGRHQLKVTKEGYFDYEAEVDMRTNTPFEQKIELKTSKMGELINKAKELRLQGLNQQSVDTLVEALKMEGSDKERAEVHLGLADSFFRLGSIDQAMSYYEQARKNEPLYYKATLGMARVEKAKGNINRSLSLIIDILLNNKDAKLAHEASDMFRELSPLKSALYINSEPPGAAVYVNNVEVGQVTPVILSDLALGNYRIEVQKNGYQTEQIKKNLKLSEFIPIFVKLKPQDL